MQNNLLKIIQKIVTEYGESILSEPRRVSALFADLAQDVPKPQKNAFLKCLEHGFVQVLKNTEESERENCKQRLAQKLNNEEGLDLGLCRETLDLLESVLFGEVQNEAQGDAKKKVLSQVVKVLSQVVSSGLSSGSGGAGYGISLVKPDTDACNNCKGCLLIKNDKCTFYDCPVLEAEDYDCGMKGSSELQKKLIRKTTIRTVLICLLYLILIIPVVLPGSLILILFFMGSPLLIIPILRKAVKKRRENAKRLSH